jgi:tyrosyl-tRNA synthetase
VCDSSGQKFGKSAGNAVYLGAEQTSYYDFYQFFLRTADADVIRYLKIFTFLTLEEIDELALSLAESPEKREAQRRLAEEVTRMVHGEEGLRIAQRSTAVLYGEAMDGLRADELLAIFTNVDSAELPRSEVVGELVMNVAAAAGLCKSRGEARRLVQNNGLNLNNVRVEGIDQAVQEDDLIDNKLLVLRSGKKRYHIIRVTN